MEVIHSGNCDCPFPGRGCTFPGWPRPPSCPGCTTRSQGPAGSPRAPSPGRGGKGRCDALAGRLSTCRRRRAPRRSHGTPAPLRSLLQPDFLFAASRPRLTSRAGKPPKAASFSETPPPAGLRPSPPRSPPRAWEATRGRGRGRGKPSGRQAEPPGAQLPGTRGRCAAVGAARGRGLPSFAGARGLSPSPSPGPSGRAHGGGGGLEFSCLCSAELPTGADPEEVDSRVQRGPSRRLRVSRDTGPGVGVGGFAYSQLPTHLAALRLPATPAPEVA